MHFRRVANKKSVLLIGLVYIHSATAATAATSTSTPQPHTECVLIITHCIAFSIVNLDNVPAKAHFHYFASFFVSILSRRGENARASARARVRIISIVGIRNMSKVSYFVYKTVESVQLRDLSAICWLIYRVDCSLTCLFFASLQNLATIQLKTDTKWHNNNKNCWSWMSNLCDMNTQHMYVCICL